MIYSIKSPLHNLTHIERPASELPGVAGVSAKRLAANIGEGAMGPTQTQVLPLSQCSHARNLCIISGYYRFKILSSAVHWFCKSNFANFQICAVETPRLLESKFQGRWKNEWYRKWCFKKITPGTTISRLWNTSEFGPPCHGNIGRWAHWTPFLSSISSSSPTKKNALVFVTQDFFSSGHVLPWYYLRLPWDHFLGNANLLRGWGPLVRSLQTQMLWSFSIYL